MRERERERLTFKEFSTVKTTQVTSRFASVVEIDCHRVLIHSHSIIPYKGRTEFIISLHPEPVASYCTTVRVKSVRDERVYSHHTKCEVSRHHTCDLNSPVGACGK